MTQRVCPDVASLKIEAARAERREQLEAMMAEAERVVANAPAAKVADPGAASLAGYLALIGLVVDPKLLSNLLVLVGVVALEAGSALALVLVRAVSATAEIQPVQVVNKQAVQPTATEEANHAVHAEKTAEVAGAETAREDVKKRVLSQLQSSGGTVSGSQRGLAKLIGADKTTMRRAINGLVMAGVVAAESSRNGTMLRLVS